MTTSKSSSLDELMELVIVEFDIKEKRENIRLRKYQKKFDFLQDSYTGKEFQVLGDLKIRSFNNMKVEIKEDGEEFQEFDKNMKSYKIIQWKEGIKTLRNVDSDNLFFNQKHTCKLQRFWLQKWSQDHRKQYFKTIQNLT